jgi:hypothetical protein
LKKWGQVPVLPPPLVAFRKQQTLTDDRLQKSAREHVGLVPLHVRVENVVDVVRIIQAHEMMSETPERNPEVGEEIRAKGAKYIRTERAKDS